MTRGLLHDDALVRSGARVAVALATAPDRAQPRLGAVTHDYAAISFYTRGRARVEHNGEWAVREGDVLLIPAGGAHRMLQTERAEYWGMALRAPCFTADDASSTGRLLAPLERVRDGAAAVVRVPAARHAFLESLFRELAASGSHEPSTRDAVQRSLLTLIFAELDRAGSENASVTRTTSVVAESLRFIERSCLRRLTLNEVAAAVGRTPAYVTTALTRATGRSAGQWIVAGKMAEARRLLLHSDERIDVIAERVGYADPTHFIRTFRRHHGATPAAWRAEQSRALAR